MSSKRLGFDVLTAVQVGVSNLSPSSTLLQDATRPTAASFPFTCVSVSNLAELYPSPQTVPAIWQIYVDTVDPVLKIFHIPTIQRQILRASQASPQFDAATESVLFAVCYAAVSVLSPAKCQQKLGTSKDDLLARQVLRFRL